MKTMKDTTPLSEREIELDILFGVINRFIGNFTRQVVSKTSNDTSCEYPFVAMDTRQAYEQIRLAYNHLNGLGREPDTLSFIDIGCGIGNILLLAEMIGFNVFGIEKDQATLTVAKNLVGEELIGDEDIWQFDRLDSYDVIYYFRPFCKKEPQELFEKLIEDGLKPGGVLIANRKMSDTINNDSRFSKLDPNWPVWFKSQD